ncbi:MAG: hypothetical protein M3Y43_05145, partial [Pseudomonadota bacterium]|nr:hypothetical protein [Pseudomonadota bacterium]
KSQLLYRLSYALPQGAKHPRNWAEHRESAGTGQPENRRTSSPGSTARANPERPIRDGRPAVAEHYILAIYSAIRNNRNHVPFSRHKGQNIDLQ